MIKLHIIRKSLKTGPRFYVYAWRGGPQIHAQDGTRPVITNDILDMAAERSEIRGADAEFDDAPYEDGLFRDLLIEAFNPNYEADPHSDDDGEDFYESVYRPFSERYGLC